jgi:Asp-tRNA(Asn)/Glu-tRNA(Gln) amidotransferase A subunit family amidase
MPNADPVFWPLDQLVGAYRTGELSPVEVTRLVLERIEAFDGALHAYLTTTPELAMQQAREAESRYMRANGNSAPPLLGVPVSIKDLFDVEGTPTTLGSLLYGKAPAEGDSDPVRKLREAGAVLVGKSNTPEFGQSATTENLLGPGCANPWDTARSAGGSSGGAAASVGAGLASLALGSDGGGSIRLPAAMCGLVGVKPTYAPISNEKFQAMTEFVCPGPIARRVADARALLGVANGTTYERRPAQSRRFGWCPTINSSPVDPGVAGTVASAVAQLEEMGHRVEPIDLPLADWLDAFGPLVLCDEWRYRRHLLEDHADELTDYARKGIEAAAGVTDKEVAVARQHQALMQQRLAAVFDEYDFVVTPTMACVAFEIGKRPTHIDGRPVGSVWGPFPFTAPFNVTGSPAASLPCGFSEGMPVGMQVVAPVNGEGDLLDICADIEEALGFPIAGLEKRWALEASAA